MSEQIQKQNITNNQYSDNAEEDKQKIGPNSHEGTFYYEEATERDNFRYDVERERANALCRGETTPVVWLYMYP